MLLKSASVTTIHAHRWFIVIAVMLSTIMEILDTTIVSVSLPHMMGSLGADRDQISWVLTSYIVAAGVLMPLTGFLVGRIGCRRLLLINILGFMFASALCGISGNLTQIVLFRLLQGVFGASLVPLSQYILRETFPAEEQPKAMAVWGIGVMAAPILGPTIGGYITDVLNWRWIFYINVPVCLLDCFLVLTFIKESVLKKETIDWIGMALLIIGISALQLFLDRGEVDDWFASTTICCLCVIFIIAFIMFLFHARKTKNAIVNLRLFKDRNFAFGTLIVVFFCAAILGSLTLLPQMLETLYGYNSNLTGLVMAPRGIASGVAMMICSHLMMKKMSARWLIIFGLAMSAVSTWVLGKTSLQANMHYFISLGIFQGIGIGCFFMPLSTIVFSSLPSQALAEAAGLFSFGRNIGNAMGISLLTTYLDRDTQANWHYLGAYIQGTKMNVLNWLNVQHLSLQDPHTLARLEQLLSVQANFLGYSHTFKLAAIALGVALCLSLNLSASKNKTNATVEAA